MPETTRLVERPNPAEFGAFFEEIHGYEPFPWQEELLKRALARGWPALIDVPTGLGKTAVLDVAVFLSALGSEHARRRVFLVVDRRLIVDQAHEEAEKIRKALDSAQPGSICGRVRECLAISGDDAASALDVTRMRGGVNWSWLWIERPDRHAIVTGTVDQVGSRLLFRGYGVGERLRPIDAAMVGTDSLIVIDEAHLSDPFFTTLRDVLATDGGGVVRPPIVVAMSASHESDGGDAHSITDADINHYVAGKRLRAAKSLRSVDVNATAADAPRILADAMAYWARQLGGPGKVIGVVANTVSMARAVFRQLQHDIPCQSSCVLLTGRIRPIDREYLLASWLPRIKSGAHRDANAELYVVATQTIEAGADIDLDGMVTQIASLSALVQRLGRVNRLGGRDNARAVVVYAEKLADPVYASAARHTWEWLTEQEAPLVHKTGRSETDLGAGLRVSPMTLREQVARTPASRKALMQRTLPYVPMITESTLDVWARTSPTPHPDVPVAPYLHGIGVGEPTVSVVWRADIEGSDPNAWMRSLDRIPPTADEAVELAISKVRRWLTRVPLDARSAIRQTEQLELDAGTSDLESQEPDAEETHRSATTGRSVLRYRSAEDWQVVGAAGIRPGDFVIVPSGWGGCDSYGWHPSSDDPVTDIADFTGWRGRRSAALRIGLVLRDAVKVLAPDLLGQIEGFLSQVRADIESESTDDHVYRALLKDMTDGCERRLPHEVVLGRLAQSGRLSEFDLDDDDDQKGTLITGLFAATGLSWNEDDSASGTSATPDRKPLTLARHQAAVAQKAGEFAVNLGMPQPLSDAVKYAARHHDEGKRDRRFQIMLHEGDRWRALVAADLLAKSGMDPADRAALWRAARLSGYPAKMRHEALSARITRELLKYQSSTDLDHDLVVHLVAAHHGCARPLLPAIVDVHPQEVELLVGDGQTVTFDTSETIDWSGPVCFDQLCQRYGRWGLALLESIVRLADIWCSARSEECDEHG
jgi:CRISPR-associated endonuclease/helicase Cas3